MNTLPSNLLASSVILFSLCALACGDKDGDSAGACESGDFQCTDDEVLLKCDDDGAWVDEADCAADGMECHADMGHCM